MPYLGLVQLIGKYVFLAGLYVFLYRIFRELFRSLKVETAAPVRVSHPVMPAKQPVEQRRGASKPTPVKARNADVSEALGGSSVSIPLGTEHSEAQPSTSRPALLRDLAPAETSAPNSDASVSAMPQQRQSETVPRSRPQSQSATAQLIVHDRGDSGLQNGQIFALTAAVTIGRSAENAIVIGDRFASSRHALIFLKDGQRILRDRGSTNGTFCNGRRVHDDIVLAEGDMLRIGTATLVYSART